MLECGTSWNKIPMFWLDLQRQMIELIFLKSSLFGDNVPRTSKHWNYYFKTTKFSSVATINKLYSICKHSEIEFCSFLQVCMQLQLLKKLTDTNMFVFRLYIIIGSYQNCRHSICRKDTMDVQWTVNGLAVRMRTFGLFNRIQLDCAWQKKSAVLSVQLQSSWIDQKSESSQEGHLLRVGHSLWGDNFKNISWVNRRA